MKNTNKLVTIFGLLILTQMLFHSSVPIVKADPGIPTSYYHDLNINGTYVYNVNQFGSDVGWYNFTPWPGDSFEGNWRTNPGGQIL
ncbi:MAG: hypothetical protein ACXAEX_10820, partial [Promethearchaeota archaeon]